MAVGGLQHTSTQAEDALSQGMEKLQQNLAETLTAAADPFELPDGAVGRRWSGRSGGLVRGASGFDGAGGGAGLGEGSNTERGGRGVVAQGAEGRSRGAEWCGRGGRAGEKGGKGAAPVRKK